MNLPPGASSFPPPERSSSKPAPAKYRCPVHALPYGEGYSCPRCTAEQAAKEAPPFRYLMRQVGDLFFQLPPATLRAIAMVLVVGITWTTYRLMRTEIVVGGDVRFPPSVQCRTKCAEATEKAVDKCTFSECVPRALDQLTACESGCDGENPRMLTPFDYSYGWGKLPEWPLVWAALVSNPELTKCFVTRPGPYALRLRVDAAGAIQNLAISAHQPIDGVQREGCIRSALEKQQLPVSKGTYVYALGVFDLGTADFAEARRLLAERVAKATQEEDTIAAAKLGQALTSVETADALRKERLAMEEERKRREAEAARHKPNFQYLPGHTSYYDPVRAQPDKFGSRAKTTSSGSSYESREHLRQMELDVERMREARAKEERDRMERVRRENMSREYMNALKEHLQKEGSE